jgi:hypothetical protein
MTAGRWAAWIVNILLLVAALGAALVVVPRYLAQSAEPSGPVEAVPPAATRHIKATLYYVSEDGLRLVPLEREVPYGEGVVEQARRLVEAQVEPPAAPLVSAIPAGTKLRALYLSDKGNAYVDLSPEVSSAHPGGALDELLTVYSIVNVLTTNLPALAAVQILVNGREVDTLAGHVDLRRPLARSALVIQEPPGAAPATAAMPGPGAAPAVPAQAPASQGQLPPRDPIAPRDQSPPRDSAPPRDVPHPTPKTSTTR